MLKTKKQNGPVTRLSAIHPKKTTENNNTYEIESSNPYDFHDESEELKENNTTKDICACCGENINTAHKNERYSCKICKKYFKQESSLESHLENFHSASKSAIECNQCNVKCVDEKSFAKHSKTHVKTSLFTCSTCNKTFTRNYQLLRHLRQTGCDGRTKDSFPCNVCGHVFARKDNLKDHLRNHIVKGVGKKVYKCETCGKEFKGKSPLVLHIRTHTGETPYKCPYCPRECKIKSALVKHIRIHTGEKPFSCKECGKSFSAHEILNRHIKTHLLVKPFVCKDCGKSFIQQIQLQTHMFYHTGEYSFKCKYCDMGFNRKKALIVHERYKHEGAKKIECTHKTCSKSFTTTEELKKHLIVHSDKSFFCDICKKGFSTKNYLKIHLRVHRKEKPRTCSKCPRAFIRTDCFLRHMRSKHPEDYKKLRLLTYLTKLEQIKLKMKNENDKLNNKITENEKSNSSSPSSSKSTTAKDLKDHSPEEKLTSNIQELLALIVEKETLESFGWPNCSVDDVLCAVIKKCGHKPVEYKGISRLEKMRENIKILLVVVINDVALDYLIRSRPIEDVIVQIIEYGNEC